MHFIEKLCLLNKSSPPQWRNPLGLMLCQERHLRIFTRPFRRLSRQPQAVVIAFALGFTGVKIIVVDILTEKLQNHRQPWMPFSILLLSFSALFLANLCLGIRFDRAGINLKIIFIPVRAWIQFAVYHDLLNDLLKPYRPKGMYLMEGPFSASRIIMYFWSSSYCGSASLPWLVGSGVACHFLPAARGSAETCGSSSPVRFDRSPFHSGGGVRPRGCNRLYYAYRWFGVRWPLPPSWPVLPFGVRLNTAAAATMSTVAFRREK
jgi:hypothetical protein